MYTGAAVLLLVVFSCCFFTAAIIIRSIFGPRHQNQRGPVPNVRSDVSFTTLDSLIAEAELLPDIVNQAGNTGAAPASGEAGTTDIIFVVMPDSTMHLGQGEEDAAAAGDKPRIVAAGKSGPQSDSAEGVASQAADSQSADNNERDSTGDASDRAVGTGAGLQSNPPAHLEQGAGNANLPSADAIEQATGSQSCNRNEAGADAVPEVEMVPLGQQQQTTSSPPSTSSAEPGQSSPLSEAADLDPAVDALSEHSLRSELYYTGDSSRMS